MRPIQILPSMLASDFSKLGQEVSDICLGCNFGQLHISSNDLLPHPIHKHQEVFALLDSH